MLQYVTAGVRGTVKLDAVTGHRLSELRKLPVYYPVEEIQRVVHMTHACSASCKVKRAVNGKLKLVHSFSENRTFIWNENFFRVGREHADQHMR